MASPRTAYDDLTPRELQVLRLMARGLTNGQIAESLDIGFETAKTHVAHIISKTGSETREEAVANWRAWNRPERRAGRWVRGLLGLPGPMKLGTGAAGVAALTVTGFLVWQALDDSEHADPQPTVHYFRMDANEPSQASDIALPFNEAIERQEAAVGGLPAPVPAYLGNRGLAPHDVAVELPRKVLPGFQGIARWSVWYGDGPTQDDSALRIGILRSVQIGREPADTDCGLPRTVSPGEWELTTTPGGEFQVLFREYAEDATVYVGASCLGTELRVIGEEPLPLEEALKILESVLAQE